MATTEAYEEFKKNNKAIRELEKYPAIEVVNWVKETLTYQYPKVYRRAFEIVRKRAWSDINADIIATVESQDYEKIHSLTEEMLSANLLTPEIIQMAGRDLGNLVAFYDNKPNIQLILAISFGNTMFKDARLETYLLYRYLTGKPKLLNGLFKKF